MDSPELEPLKYEWFGATFQAEGDYGKTVEAAEELAKKFPIVVLKGLAVARKYPIPSHRASVDLDVYINDDDDDNDDDDRLLQNVKVIRDDYKHTGFMFQGVMVEYHKSLIAWKSLKNGRFIEKTLRDAGVCGIDDPCGGICLRRPFNRSHQNRQPDAGRHPRSRQKETIQERPSEYGLQHTFPQRLEVQGFRQRKQPCLPYQMWMECDIPFRIRMIR